jgi:hypothetical protein
VSIIRRLTPVNRWLEPLFATAVVASAAYALWHLFTFAYLPQPFFYEPFDIWADWFNTAYWAYDPGTYDNWRTLYPPLSFVFLDLVTLDRCYPMSAGDYSAGLPARSCDWLGLASLHLLLVLCVVLVGRTFWKMDRRTAPWRTLAMGLGWPLLDALERGNLMLAAFACMVLAYGPLLKSARLRWLAAGLAVNFKVYLIASIIPLLLRRRWRWVEGALLSVVLVYLVSFAWLGRGTPTEIYRNISSWNANDGGQLLDLWVATTYLPLEKLLKGDIVPLMQMIGSDNVDLLLILIPLTLHFVQAMILLAALAVWLRPHTVPNFRVVNLGVMMALITADSGAYTPAYFIFFVFLERWRGFAVKYAIVMCYVLSISADIRLDPVPPVVRETYLWATTTTVVYYITLGSFIRPLIILTIPLALSCATIYAVWRDFYPERFIIRRFRAGKPSIVRAGDRELAASQRSIWAAMRSPARPSP